MNTLLVLIDFHGHPDFTTDPTTDIVRYSNLTNIIFDRKLDRDKFRIYSTEIPKRDRKLFEIQEMSRKKIEIDQKNPKFLQTIRGAGYVLWIE